MAQPFAFPPPPPPPPKQNAQPNRLSQAPAQNNRGSNRGRGFSRAGFTHHGNFFRGRGRGPGPRFMRDSNSTTVSTNSGEISHGQRPEQNNVHLHNERTSPLAKRSHATAFETGITHSSRPRAPPAVPSFNIDIENLLSKKTNEPVSSQSVPTKKVNLLGLTPSQKEEEPASEGEDEDEEARLAALAQSDGITFKQRGQTLTLRTPEDVAAWIAERKKNFPTKARVEAAKKKEEEQNQKREAARREREEAARVRKQERDQLRQEREKQRLKQKLLAKVTADAKAAIASKKQDGAEVAKLRAEKLRKKAERAARQLQEAEAAIKEAEAAAKLLLENRSELQAPGTMSLADALESDNDTVDSTSVSSDKSVVEDTSSSGSSDSESENDSNAAPEELSSKNPVAQRVQPHTEVTKSPSEPRLCRNLLKFGKCKYGKRCNYSHKIPKRNSKSEPGPYGSRIVRKSLFQVMVEKEQEEERRLALEAAKQSGKKGLVDSSDQGNADQKTLSAPEQKS